MHMTNGSRIDETKISWRYVDMSEKTKIIISFVMYLIGFIIYIVFLHKNNLISWDAWLNTLGACFGVLLFCTSFRIRK